MPETLVMSTCAAGSQILLVQKRLPRILVGLSLCLQLITKIQLLPVLKYSCLKYTPLQCEGNNKQYQLSIYNCYTKLHALYQLTSIYRTSDDSRVKILEGTAITISVQQTTCSYIRNTHLWPIDIASSLASYCQLLPAC